MKNKKFIFEKLNSEIKNPIGVYALMGNLQAESALNPKNLQNSYEKKLGFNDETYTKAVDEGKHDFVNDRAGYGLAQWTFWSRKSALLNYAKKCGKSIGDLEMQLCFLLKELKGYPKVWKCLTKETDLKTVSDMILTDYERPADQTEKNKIYRAGLGEKIKKELEPAKKTVSVIADEVIKGLWGNGAERKKMLEAVGYNYRTVQNAVNKKLKGE